MACADPRPRTPRIDRPGDKQAVYGDPTLLPTREGERVRMEVALAREIEQALAVLPTVARARVDVELPPRGHAQSPRVLAVLELPAEVDPEPSRPSIDAIIETIAGPAARTEIVIASASPSAPSPEPPPSVLLLLAVLGLGISTGIAIERARVLWGRASSPRPR